MTATASQKLKPGGREIYENINPPEICRNLREGFDFHNPFFLSISEARRLTSELQKSIAHSFHKVGGEVGKEKQREKNHSVLLTRYLRVSPGGVYERVM